MPLQEQFPPDPSLNVRVPKLQVRGRDLPSLATNASPDSSPQSAREANSSSPRDDNSGSELGPVSSWSPDSSPPRSRNGSPDNLSNKRRRKERSSLLGFFSTKEPSHMALKEFAKQQKSQTQVKGQRSITPGFHNQKLPKSVPKVNSKWDGMPNHFHHKEGKPWEASQQSTSITRSSTKTSATSSISDAQRSSVESPAKSKSNSNAFFTYVQPPRSPKRTRVAPSATSSDAETSKPPKQLKRESVHRTASFDIPVQEDPRAAFRRSWSESQLTGKPRFSFLDHPDSDVDVDVNGFFRQHSVLQENSDSDDFLKTTPSASPESKQEIKSRKLLAPIVTSVAKFKLDVGTRYPIEDSPVADSKARGLEAELSSAALQTAALQTAQGHGTQFPIFVPAHPKAEPAKDSSYFPEVDSGTMYSPATPISPVSALSHDSPISPSSPVSPISFDFQDTAVSEPRLPVTVSETHHSVKSLEEPFKPVAFQKSNEWPLPPSGIPNWPLQMSTEQVVIRSSAPSEIYDPPTTPKQSNYSFLSSEAPEVQQPKTRGGGESQSKYVSRPTIGANDVPPPSVPVTPPRNFSRATPPRSPQSPQSPMSSLNIPKTPTGTTQGPSRPLLGPPGRAVSKGISLPSIPESDASSILSIPLGKQEDKNQLESGFRSTYNDDEDEDEDDLPTPRASPSASPEPIEAEYESSKQRLGLGGIIRHNDDFPLTSSINQHSFPPAKIIKPRKTPFFSGKLIK